MAETGKAISLNLALGRIKTLLQRHNELCHLRDNNAKRTTRFGIGKDAEKEEVIPTFNARDLDHKITILAKEIRLLDEAIKETNQKTDVIGYLWNDEVLAEILDDCRTDEK